MGVWCLHANCYASDGQLDCAASPAGHSLLQTLDEGADVVEAEEPAVEDVVTFGVLSVHPPREVQQQAMEDPLEEVEIAVAALRVPLDLEGPPRRPRMHPCTRPTNAHRRWDVALARKALAFGQATLLDAKIQQQWAAHPLNTLGAAPYAGHARPGPE